MVEVDYLEVFKGTNLIIGMLYVYDNPLVALFDLSVSHLFVAYILDMIPRNRVQ